MKYKTNKMKYLVSCLLTTANLLFLVNFVSADVTYVAAPVGGPNKFFEYKGVLNITCNVSSTPPSNDYKMQWFKDEQDVKTIDGLKSRILQDDQKSGVHTLQITKPVDGDIGKYTCVVLVDNKPVTNTTVNAVGKGIVKTQSNINVVEGEKLRIHCQVLGRPIIEWRVGNTTYDGSDKTSRIQLLEDEEKDLDNAILVIQNIVMEDRGSYTCVARNVITKVEESSSTSFIRVKDKLAALWPFLGICAEVIILCAIILIYEKKRNKQELDESDTDQSPDQKNTPDHGKDTDVRQRK